MSGLHTSWRVLDVARGAASALAVLVATGCAPRADSARQRMGSLNKEALADFHAGELERAKVKLGDAIVIGKSAGLNKTEVMARSYVNLGAVYVGLKDREKGIQNF